jgi:hypothetical protein
LSDRAEDAGWKETFVRLRKPQEQERWDQLVCQHHCLKNANLVGERLGCLVESQDQWPGLVGWSATAFHIRARDQWINWNDNQRRVWLRWAANTPQRARITTGNFASNP